MAIGVRQQQRRGTAAEWNTSDYILAAGELGVTTDTGIVKIGDGVNGWTDLEIAFDSTYLSKTGKAADSELLDGISSESFLKVVDATTAATADKVALRNANGRLKAATGVSTDDVVNYDQLMSVNSQLLISRSVTGAITLALSDVGRMIHMNNTVYSPTVNCTVPPNSGVAFPVGSFVDIVSTGKGTVTLVPGSGVTIVGPVLIFGQGSSVRLIKTATDTWFVSNAVISPGPILRRKIKTGTDNNAASTVHTRMRLDGADDAGLNHSNNYDTLGAGEQWSAADNYRAFVRREGWYDVGAQISYAVTGAGRIQIQLRVNNTIERFGRGIDRANHADVGASYNTLMPLSVDDYVEVWVMQESGSTQAPADNQYSSSHFNWAWVRPL